MKAVTLARTIYALGLSNVARVALYRLGLKSGLGPVLRIRSQIPIGPFFPERRRRADLPLPSSRWTSEARYFGARSVPLANGAPPDWFFNPYADKTFRDTHKPWWSIPDFDPNIGDIKIIWEPSRFAWMIPVAQRAACGDETAADQMERWLSDWCSKNPPYLGPNWKCGQEASIRVMHLAMAALILGSHDRPAPGLVDLIAAHLMRIAPTVQYAIGQDNNHGTSEAAALFIGGSWLTRASDPRGARWEKLGRNLLADRVLRLVARDGSFSQHSVVYHRLMLDTMVMAEAWRARNALPAFPGNVTERLALAAKWLFAMTDGISGDAPNLGANDGAHLLNLTDADYRDFRQTVQMSMALFCGVRALPPGPWDDAMRRLGLPPAAIPAGPPQSVHFSDGGYAVLRGDATLALLRYPKFRFRPAQADALHVDLWVEGENLLRDAGTYSYSADAATLERFAGTAAHNTIMFDAREQMPRLGRFLYGDWLKATDIAFDSSANVARAAYTDRHGARHSREVRLEGRTLRVKDTLSGPFERAVLRWRLAPGEWALDGEGASDGKHRIRLTSTAPFLRVALEAGLESRHYLESSRLPVLEAEVGKACEIESEISWS